MSCPPGRNRTSVNCLKGSCSTIELRGARIHTVQPAQQCANKGIIHLSYEGKNSHTVQPEMVLANKSIIHRSYEGGLLSIMLQRQIKRVRTWTGQHEGESHHDSKCDSRTRHARARSIRKDEIYKEGDGEQERCELRPCADEKERRDDERAERRNTCLRL